MPLDKVEKAALRNSAVVGVGFALLKLLKRKGKRKSGEWNEAMCSAASAGLTAEVFGRLKGLTGDNVAGVASLLPLRLISNNNDYFFNYRFVVCYLLAQILVNLLPKGVRKYPVLLNSINAAQLLSSWILYEDRLPLAYKNFLHSQGKATREHIVEVRAKFNHGTYAEVKELVFPQKKGDTYARKHGTSFHQLNAAAVDYFVHHWLEAAPFYMKIYGMRVMVHVLRKIGASGLASIFSTDPAPALSLQATSLFIDIFRSTTFLSLYCTSAWWMLGQSGNLLPDTKCSSFGLWASLAVPGLMLAVESPAQRVTISNYCTTFALYPLLCRFEYGFDAAGVAMSLLTTTGTARRPMLLNMLWG